MNGEMAAAVQRLIAIGHERDALLADSAELRNRQNEISERLVEIDLGEHGDLQRRVIELAISDYAVVDTHA